MRFQSSALACVAAAAMLASLEMHEVTAFAPIQASPSTTRSAHATTALSSAPADDQDEEATLSRRQFGMAGASAAMAMLLPGMGVGGVTSSAANAQVYFDPAMYGDQELRVGTVDTVRERVRRAILQNPKLAPSFYQVALLDSLSYDAKSNSFGPNGNVIYAVLNSKINTDYVANLKEAAQVLIQAEKDLKKKTAVSIADCVAIAGGEAIESIGGPALPVQLGRMDIDSAKNKDKAASSSMVISSLPIDILSGNKSPEEVRVAFQSAGLTDREMTALLGALMTLERVEKTRTTEDWKQSAKPKFVERGKMGRMSDYKRLTDEDIIAAEQDEFDEDPDDGWYIADSFGTRDDRFGDRIAKDDINEKNFNKYIKDLQNAYVKRDGAKIKEYGWIAEQILDPESPTSQAWLKKYADSNLSYTKDLSLAFNAATQLGAVYTGGKYENLLKNKQRKALNDDELNLF